MAKVTKKAKKYGYIKKKRNKHQLSRELPRDAAGNRQYAPAVTFVSDDEAETELDKHAVMMRVGENNPKDELYVAHIKTISAKKGEVVKHNISMSDLLTMYANNKLNPKNGGESTWAPTTEYANKNIAEHITKSVLGSKNIRVVGENDFDEYFSIKRKNGSKHSKTTKPRLAENTIRKHFDFLRAALAWAVEKNMIDRNPLPMTLQPIITEPEIEYYSLEEERALLAAAIGNRILVLIALCCYLAIRRSEALTITWANINCEEANVSIVHSRTRVGGQDYYRQVTRGVWAYPPKPLKGVDNKPMSRAGQTKRGLPDT